MTTQQSPHTPPMETMRAPMSMVMCVLLGAVGFGIGGAIASYLLFLGNNWVVLGFLLGGALGGASLGLAFRDLRRVFGLALMGGVGLLLGSIAGLLIAGSLGVFYAVLGGGVASEVIMVAIVGASVGAVLGASLGLAFVDLRTIVTLAVAGAVGFSVGFLPIGLIPGGATSVDDPRTAIYVTIATTVGGAFLGATLRYLEHRKLAQQRGPRVR